MKIHVSNLTDATQYLELGAKGDLDKTHVIGPKARESIQVPTEAKFLVLSKQYKGIFSFRKQPN